MQLIKNNIFRNLVPVVLLLCLAVSCSDNDAEDLRNGGRILFSPQSSKVKAVGRAQESYIFPDGASFGVFGINFMEGSGTPAQKYEVFDNTPVTNTNGFWDTARDSSRYWQPGMTYRFRGIYPYTDMKSAKKTYLLSGSFADAGAYTISDFNAGLTGTPPDLMVSEIAERGPVVAGQAQPPVQLKFRHLLTQIRLNIKKAQDIGTHTVNITSVKLKGFRVKGDYSCTGKTGRWTVKGVADMEGINESSFPDNGLVGKKGLNVWWDGGAYVIPQEMLPGIGLTVNFVTSYMEGGVDVVKSESKSAPLPGTALLEEGKRITYNVVITSSNNIVFGTPTVEPWEVSNSNNTIVIK